MGKLELNLDQNQRNIKTLFEYTSFFCGVIYASRSLLVPMTKSVYIMGQNDFWICIYFFFISLKGRFLAISYWQTAWQIKSLSNLNFKPEPLIKQKYTRTWKLLNVSPKIVFCYQNCPDSGLLEKKILVMEKDFWNLRLKAKNKQNLWEY